MKLKASRIIKKNMFFALTILVSLYGAAQNGKPFTSTRKSPNVVFILADDLGYGDLGCYGQTKIATPNIDELARQGMKFTQFYAGTSVCAPSRASLMTGLHTGHTAVRGNYEIEPEGQLPIPDSAFTLAELFKNAGYATGGFGKWGLGFPGSEGAPEKQGFDRFFGYNCQRQSHNYFPDHLWDNNQRIVLTNTLVSQVQYAPELIQQKALTFIEANQTNPFFLYLAYTLPHAGLQLPAGDKVFDDYKKQFKEQPKKISQAWDGVGYQPQAYPHAAYAAMVTKLDAYIGEVVAKLKSLGLDENTLIIFTSDNGPHREGGNTPDFFDSNGDFKGIKRDLYEGGVRVPMIACWPSKIKGNKVVDQMGAFWDFFPTFAQLIQQPIPTNADGISLYPTLLSKSKRSQKQHPYLYWEFHEDGGRQAVRIGNWKGVRVGVLKDPNGPIELYDLSSDPGESKNIAAQNLTVIEQMKNIMQNAHVENKDFHFVKKSF